MAEGSTPKNSYNIISNRESLDNEKKKIIDKIKLELFETMKIEELMVNRNNLSNSISENRTQSGVGYPKGEIVLNNDNKITIDETKYKDILSEYDKIIKDKETNNLPDNDANYNKKLDELDTQLAERIILDNGLAIEFEEGNEYYDGKFAQQESEIAYTNLNKLEDYKGKLELVSKQKDSIDYFVIKWTEEQKKQLDFAKSVIDIVSGMNEREIEKLKEQNEKNIKKINELKKRLDDKEYENNNENNENRENDKDEKNDSEKSIESPESIEFSDSDGGRTFAEYCKNHKIIISGVENVDYNDFKNFMNTNFQYVDGDGFIWKLIPLYGGAQIHDDKGGHTEYKFEKTEQKVDRTKDEKGDNISILDNFDDGDSGSNFYNYCKNNGIIKESGETTEGTKNFKNRIDANCNYLDKDGNILKLIPINGGAAGEQNPDGPVARYSFINTGKKYSQTIPTKDPKASTDGPESGTDGPESGTDGPESGTDGPESGTDDPEASTDGPEASTDDSEASTDGPEASTDGPEASTDDSEASTDGPEASTDDPEPLYEQKERVATISNVNQVNRAIVQREADEELRQRYEKSGWNIFDKANLFLRRKFIKDRMVNKKMNGKKGFDWSESGQSAADRHQIEQENAFADRMKVVIQDIDSANYPETRRRMDELLGRLTGNKGTTPPRKRAISDSQFQTEFQNILDMSGKVFDKTKPGSATSTNWRPISEIIKKNDINQLSTNILMQANKFREHQRMTRNIADHIARNPRETETAFNSYCRNEIKTYISTFNDIPDFLQQMGVSLDNVDATKEIKRLQAHTGALTTIATQSLKLRIQMLDDGGEAYNVRKEGGALTKIGRFLDDPTGGENTKFGKWMNKHPNLKEAFGRVWGATKIGVMVTPSLLLAPVGPLAVAGAVGGTSFLTTLFKKKSHYEKENRSYQRMQATNLEEYRKKREDLANEVAGMKRYEGRFWGEKAKIRKQYKDYICTTQDQLSLSTGLTKKIESRLQSNTALSVIEQTNLVADVADGLARLDYHKKTGQNFLGSNNPAVAEKEYRALQAAVMGGLSRLGLNADDIRNNSPYDVYYNNSKTLIEDGTGDGYDNQGYLTARKKFRRRSNGKARGGALKAGAISFGLSYLASSLASRDKTRTIETETNMHNGKIGGEYNPGDMQEHLFVSGDVNPAMNSVINGNTSEITGGFLYSSVDAMNCSAAKGAAELAAAQADLATALSNPVVAGNPDLVSAINNYIADATSKIGGIPGLSAGNHDLNLARAIEAAKEGILDPIITSGNSSIVVNPTGLLWTNGGTQATGGAIGQTFRNMGIMGLDYVQHGTEEIVEHITRAIPIPVGLNTFGATRGDPRDKQKQ